MRYDSDVISIFTTDKESLNKKNAEYAYRAYNYDLKNRKRIQLSDLFSDTDELSGMIADDLKSKYPDVEFDTDSSTNVEEALKNQIHDLMDNTSGGFTFYMTPTGIVFAFAPETLASFKAGTLTVEYSYDSGALTGNYNSSYSGPGNLKGKFVSIIPETEVSFVEDQDKVHTLSIYETPTADTDADYPSDFNVTLTFDGKKSSSMVHSYDTEYYLAETKNGKYYLLADTTEENDWQTIYIFDLNGKKINKP